MTVDKRDFPELKESTVLLERLVYDSDVANPGLPTPPEQEIAYDGAVACAPVADTKIQTPVSPTGAQSVSEVQKSVTESLSSAAVEIKSSEPAPFYVMNFEKPWGMYIDKKQLFNSLYLAVGFICCLVAQSQVTFPANVHLLGSVFTCAMVALLALLYLVALRMATVRPAEKDFPYTFSKPARSALRAFTLLLPCPFIFCAVSFETANNLYNKGQTYVAKDDYKQAAALFEKSAFLNPWRAQTFDDLAYANICLGKYDAGIRSANSALALAPLDYYALAQKAWGLNCLNRYVEAEPFAKQSIEISPRNGEAFAALSDSYLGMGSLDLALEAAKTHLDIHRNESAAYIRLARVLDAMQQFDEANAVRAAEINHEYWRFVD